MQPHELRQKLQKEIFEQDQAVNALVRAITISNLGSTSIDHPLANLLFLGPTGVGKSQIIRSLAKIIQSGLIVINCTEYQLDHDIEKLIGAPPGYAGHDKPSFFEKKLDTVNKKNTIILFEELEKASDAFFNLLLEILERGTLTQGNGIEINFKNCFFIFTSNLGSNMVNEVKKEKIGFSCAKNFKEEKIQNIYKKAYENKFSPEFINRIDEIVIFNSLSKESLNNIFNKFLQETYARLIETQITIEPLSEEIKTFLIEKGTSLEYGARPLKRTIRQYLEFPLANAVSYYGTGNYKGVFKGGRIRFVKYLRTTYADAK